LDTDAEPVDVGIFPGLQIFFVEVIRIGFESDFGLRIDGAPFPDSLENGIKFFFIKQTWGTSAEIDRVYLCIRDKIFFGAAGRVLLIKPRSTRSYAVNLY